MTFKCLYDKILSNKEIRSGVILKKKDSNVLSKREKAILKFIENYMLDLKASGVQWGYDIPYLCTGRLNQHPRAAIAAIKEGRKDYAYFNLTLMDRE